MKKTDCKRFRVQSHVFRHHPERKHKMRVRAWPVLFVLMCGILFSTVMPGEAVEASEGKWVMDGAGLLTEEEVEALDAVCEQICEKHSVSAPIITTKDFGGGDIKEWQRKVFREYDLGVGADDSGILLAVSMAERDWGIVAFGSAQEAFTTYGREKIGGQVVDYLSDGEYYEAFSAYLKLADEFLTEAEKGEPYSESHRFQEGWRIPLIIGVSFVISLIVSLIVVMSWKKSMNTRVRQETAGAYLTPGSFSLSESSDRFLYHTVSRTKRQKENSGSGGMHSDSSGTSGKF